MASTLRKALYDKLVAAAATTNVFYSVSDQKIVEPIVTFSYIDTPDLLFSGHNSDITLTISVIGTKIISSIEDLVERLRLALDCTSLTGTVRSTGWVRISESAPYRSDDMCWQSNMVYSFKITK